MFAGCLRNWHFLFHLSALAVAVVSLSGAVLRAQEDPAHTLANLANQARADAGLKSLQWDPALATAARAHAERMAREGQLSHQYSEEPDVARRAASAGAHFGLIEENIAMADSPRRVHESWMKSPAHHDNLLNPQINRIGVGVVQAHGYLYAVADYAQGVNTASPEQVEASVAKVLAAKGLRIKSDGTKDARIYCAGNEDMAAKPIFARFLIRWQNTDVTQLPPQLEQRIASGVFHEAAVGACAPQGERGSDGPVFSGNRVAVLLY